MQEGSGLRDDCPDERGSGTGGSSGGDDRDDLGQRTAR